VKVQGGFEKRQPLPELSINCIENLLMKQDFWESNWT